MRGLTRLLVLACLCATPAALHAAATITIVNADGVGEGFNDPAPTTPVGGNNGTTLGQQRLIAFQQAASIWSSVLTSNVEIRIRASFDSQQCTATTAVLGSAGPAQSLSDFAGAPLSNVWYSIALANKLARTDLAPQTGSVGDDIVARFNSNLGKSTCLGGRGWYYGLDGNHGNDIDLIVVLLHEFGHGLGFLSLVEETTGELFLNKPDIAATFIFDNTAGLPWHLMTNGQRSVSAANNGNLVWIGPSATAAAPNTLSPARTVTINSPTSIAGDLEANDGAFGATLTVAGVTGSVEEALDAADETGPSLTDGCTAFTNAFAISGKLALIDRGTCPFVVKIKNAQNAGAIGVIIVNNVAGLPPLGGSDPEINIPALGIATVDGDRIRPLLAAGVNATLRANPPRLAGADPAGRLRLYAPNPVEPGSSISHWDRTAIPNLLMEPAINAGIPHDVDLTRNFFEDIGWFIGDALTPAMRATKRATLVADSDGNGGLTRGEMLSYSIVLTNLSTSAAATGVVLSDLPDTNSTLIQGSVITSQGAITSGNGSSDVDASVEIGTIPPGGSVTITLQTRVNGATPREITQITNQAVVTGSNIARTVTDDPATPASRDATQTRFVTARRRAIRGG